MDVDPNPSPSSGPSSDKWTAILLAGDRPGGDPFAAEFGVPSKALVPIGGKPLLAHVAQTLLSHPRIGDVVILAQSPDELLANPALAEIGANPRVRRVVSGPSIAGSIAETLRSHAAVPPVLVTTADHVLLDHKMIDWFLAEADSGDIAVGMVNRETARQEGLDGGRTWIRFSDAQVTGANLFALRSDKVNSALDYWRSLEAHRKRPSRMAREIGPWLLLKFVLGILSLDSAFAALEKKLGVKAKAVQIPYARAGVDVDKAADHALVETLMTVPGQ